MIYSMDGKVQSGSAIRCLCYTEDGDLTGPVLRIQNAPEEIECAVGSIAMKPGLTAIKQLGPEGWVDAE